SGQEQVYLVATFTTLMFTGWNTTYAAGTQTQVLDAEYLGETLAPPPAAKITRVIPKSAPAFQRLTIPRVTTLSVAHIDDAYFSFQGFAGESTAAGHAGQTRATSVTFSVMWQVVARKAGGVNGTITGFYLNQTQAKLNITKAMGSTTAAFISAQATHKTFGGTIQLVQHVGSSDIVRYTIQVQNALVLSDTTQASSSGQIETLGLVPSQAITVTDATTNASGRVE
ncbi:MAG: type VI secretion system tube protein Hcp, partial [Polyangiaceae bacterium]